MSQLTAHADRGRRSFAAGALFWKGLSLVVPLLLAACSPLAIVNSFVPTDGLSATRDIAYGGADRQRLDVYRPSAANGAAANGAVASGATTSATAPVVIFFYGGSWQGGSRAEYLFVAEALAARGAVVVLPDYRIYPEIRFPRFMEDAAAAVRWVRDHAAEHGGDPKRIFLMGHSAGAHIAVLLSLDARYLAAQGLSPGDLKGTIGLAGPYDFLPLTSEGLRAVFGQDIGADLGPTQPVNFAANSDKTPPLMLMHGIDDGTVYPRNTIRLAQRLREAGKAVEEIHYEGIGHYTILLSMARPTRGLSPVLDDTARFIGAH
jgi:acetyl esterase/lipase